MKKLLLIAFVFIGLAASAQDPQFSQYYQAPLYLNPGFTGITPQQRIVLNHRIQWPSLPQAFQTSAFSYDIFVNELRSGFGLLVTTDKMGSAGWRTTTASLLYSYKIKLTEKIVFSPGLSFGYGTNGLDRSKLRLGDGLEYDGISLDPDVNKLGRQSYFDFGSGFLLYSKSLWLGASFAHMNRPNLSVLNDVSRLGMKTAIHGGIRLDLSGGLSNRGRASYLTPSFIYRMQGNTFTQLDLGLNYHVDPISVGVWYRGKPFQKTVINSITQDALILYLGLYFKSLTIGYSYDFTISEMQTASGGAHEISIVYEFNSKPSNKSVKKKYKLIPCPTFNSKEGFWN
ncbi:type IX secretion system membrane protein, PorP/SprF family [Chryseolinea serpens]|uniref:Type IX secretion system membrane protein, PorP/SprF family n=1 Tax=Chryseolinea serpens TaxID=947013 RepID=A0A1M5KCB1_9BACT|nr:type IX secretion system membrane protein PorP/SprF [Chryseolinea serpens]SHG50425.1 type IX secretion system membrane protein, PorP/SprF family [Chryseolinea serpens]